MYTNYAIQSHFKNGLTNLIKKEQKALIKGDKITNGKKLNI